MSRIFSSRKGQALEALENALGRCEREGIVVYRTCNYSLDGIIITILGTYWEDDSIFLIEEKDKFPKT